MTLAILAVLAANPAAVEHLEFKVRVYPDVVVYGDPLYIEFRMINHSDEDIDCSSDRDFRDPRRVDVYVQDYEYNGSRHEVGTRLLWGLKSMFDPKVFRKRSTTTWYKREFVPPIADANRGFWQCQASTRKLVLECSYTIYVSKRLGEVRVMSEPIGLRVKSRDSDEISILDELKERDANRDPETSNGPAATDFGIGLAILTDPGWAHYAAENISGGLGELIRLSVRLNELYQLSRKSEQVVWSDEARQKERQLLRWLLRQPDIKRPMLLLEVESLAERYNMHPLRESVQKLRSLEDNGK